MAQNEHGGVRVEQEVRRYPLKIENVGEDTFILMSKGHHDPHKFMRAVREHYKTWSLGFPTHEWMRAVPSRSSDYSCIYVETEPHARGAFACTYTREAYGEDCYKAPSA